MENHGSASVRALAHAILLEPVTPPVRIRDAGLGTRPVGLGRRGRLTAVLFGTSACLLVGFCVLHLLGWTSAPVPLYRTLVAPTAAPP